MPELGSEAKASIDSLSKADLRQEVNLGDRSRFQREKMAYVKTRLNQIEQEETENHWKTEETRREKEVELAQDANSISRGANRLSVFAIAISLISLVVAVMAFYLK